MSSNKVEDLLSATSSGAWRTVRHYLSAILVTNLTWEILHLPLYTIWYTGSFLKQAFAVIHCTAGDLLIAAFTFGLALLTLGNQGWPALHFKRVAIGATVLGVGYTVFSEWLNTSVHYSWAYSDLMPVVSVLGFKIGLSPMLQWSVIPPVCFAYARWRQKVGSP